MSLYSSLQASNCSQEVMFLSAGLAEPPSWDPAGWPPSLPTWHQAHGDKYTVVRMRLHHVSAHEQIKSEGEVGKPGFWQGP